MSRLGTDSYQLATQIRDRLATVPDTIEDYMGSRIQPPEYWRKLANRIPRMVQFIHDQARIGTEDGHAVINMYLPAQASPNLTLAGSLLVLSEPGAGPAAVAVKPKGPKTIEELLTTKGSFAFDQSSLEFALRDIALEFNETYSSLETPLEIQLMGTDLEKSSITRNQQITNFDVKDTPLEDILVKLVMQANPVPNITDPTVPDQKLIWVVWADPDNGGKKKILLTTRAAAIEKGYTMPKVFQPK